MFLGQGVVPKRYDPLVEIQSDPQIEQFLGNIAATIDRRVEVMPAVTPTSSRNIARQNPSHEAACCYCLQSAVRRRLRHGSAPSRRQLAEMWLTTADRDAEAVTAARCNLRPVRRRATKAVTIDTSKHFQKMHGFGAAMTDASA